MVDVSSQNNSVSINVSSSGNSASIKASPDTAQYYSEKSREWAISNRIVDGVDYSSKYYAQQSGANAQKVVESENKVKEIYNTLLEESSSISDGVREVGNETLTNIETVKSEAIDSINNTKTTILNDIEFVADGEKKEIEDLIDSGKDELKEAIGDVKVLTTLDIGDIGIAPLGIDETKGKRRYLNGQLIIQEQYVQFTNKVKSAIALYPTLACTEEEWQTIATMTVGGQVGKFVVDDEAGTIRLPKIIMPIQGLTDLSKLAEIVEAGLPNITGDFHDYGIESGSASGAFRYNSNNLEKWAHTDKNYIGQGGFTFDASRSSSIYGKSNTVQQEQIQYPYFIQVATGAETEDNIINEIELNNPFFLGMSQYFESEPNNISWLKSAGQYNSKAIYPAYYDWLLKIYNGVEIVEGVSVKLSTEEYTDYDFVLNTAEETFRLPLLDGSECLPSDRYDDLTLGASGDTYTAPANGWLTFGTSQADQNGFIRAYNENNILCEQDVCNFTGSALDISIPCKKGHSVLVTYHNAGILSYFRFVYAQGNGSLYFYVGETVQNANLINAGRIEEHLHSLIPDNSELITSYGIPDYSAGISGTFTSQTITAPFSGLFVYAIQNVGSGGVRYISVNGCMVAYLYNTSSNLGTTRCFPVSKGDIISTSVSAPVNESYNLYPFKGVN